ncbi:MAG TPA: hypothetical protein VLT47_08555 [Anaeromyxobacteraceae bacterium]|nr:hypothetical protein [Anaeromyxobacteraceae bacterium]
MHLDAHSYAALLEGTMPPEEARALSTHLDGECEQCEGFLAAQSSADSLDGVVDAWVGRALPPTGGQGNDLEFARITRSLRTARGGARSALLAGTIAASILVAGVAGLVASRDARAPTAKWDGVKGVERPIPVRLRFLELTHDRAIQKGLSGEAVDRSASLLFEAETSRAAWLAIARVSADGSAEVVWRARSSGGRVQVGLGGRPAAYPLAGLAGPQRFVLVASEAPLDDLRVLKVGRSLAPPADLAADAPELSGLSLDVVELTVQ